MEATDQERQIRRIQVLWIERMVSSYLRGGNMRKSSLIEIEGAKRRLELYGIPKAQIIRAIGSGIEESPNSNSPQATELRKRYLQ